MYFVVPKDRSIIKSLFKTSDLWKAQKHADALRAEKGTHFDGISVSSVYTTQTLGEVLEQDRWERVMLLAAEAEAAAPL